MWAFILLIIVLFILLTLSIIFIVRFSYNLISNYVNNKYIKWIISCIPVFLLAIGLFIDTINAIVVDIHLITIFTLIKLFFFIIKKISNKKFNDFIILSITIIICLFILIPAHHQAYDVKQTKYSIQTNKDINSTNFRIIQISDSHIGCTMSGKKFSKYMEEISKLTPDIVVITGDFVDDETTYKDMLDACNGLGSIKTNYGIYFVLGNHDEGYYNNRDFNFKQLKEHLEQNNVIILEDEVIYLSNNVVLIGRKDASDKGRENIIDLSKNIDKNKYIITLDHQPNDYENEIKSEIDLVLSGHTHGGHIFPIGQLSLLLGVNDKIYGKEKIENTTFIVNSGISGWGIKFRTASIAEYVIIDITKQ